MKSGSQRFETAGLSYIKQVSSADKKASQAGREKNTGRGGKKESKKGALCSLSNERDYNLMTVSLYLVSDICDDLCVSLLQQVKNRCGPDVSPWSAMTFDLIFFLPATDTLRGRARASWVG